MTKRWVIPLAFLAFAEANAADVRLGAIVSAGSSVNNSTTAAPFSIPASVQSGTSRLALQCSAAVHYRVGTSASVTAAATDYKVDPDITIDAPGATHVAIIPSSGTATCQVFQTSAPVARRGSRLPSSISPSSISTTSLLVSGNITLLGDLNASGDLHLAAPRKLYLNAANTSSIGDDGFGTINVMGAVSTKFTTAVVVNGQLLSGNANANYLTLTGFGSGSSPRLQAVGADANVNLALWAQGSGVVQLNGTNATVTSAGLITTASGVNTGVTGYSISGKAILGDDLGMGAGIHGTYLRGTAISGASAKALKIGNEVALTALGGHVVDFVAGPTTTFNNGSERNMAYRKAFLGVDGVLQSATPALIGVAFVNATVAGGQTYWRKTLPATPARVTALSINNTTASAGAGNVVLRVSDGSYNCDATVACGAFSGNVGIRAVPTGSCGFAANSTLTMAVQTSGCATTQPTFGGNVEIEGMWQCGDAPLHQCGEATAWIGDSLTRGEYSPGDQPPDVLYALRPKGSVANYGRGGNTCNQALSNWTTNVRNQGYERVIIACGINSILQGIPSGAPTPAAIFADLQTIADQAISDGAAVTISTVLPGNLSGANETKRTDLNALIISYCSANGLACFNACASNGAGDDMCATGANSTLKSAYNGGDNLHLSSAGSIAWATGIKNVLP